MTGLIVRAKAGREKDRYFVIVAQAEKYAYIADGKERRLQKPKRKSIKHLSITNTEIELTDLTDRKLRRLLSEFTITSEHNNT